MALVLTGFNSYTIVYRTKTGVEKRVTVSKGQDVSALNLPAEVVLQLKGLKVRLSANRWVDAFTESPEPARDPAMHSVSGKISHESVFGQAAKPAEAAVETVEDVVELAVEPVEDVVELAVEPVIEVVKEPAAEVVEAPAVEVIVEIEDVPVEVAVESGASEEAAPVEDKPQAVKKSPAPKKKAPAKKKSSSKKSNKSKK